MGSGSWNSAAYVAHSTVTRGFDSFEDFRKAPTQELFRSNFLSPLLNPHGVTRECRDSAEHPNTVPVILALDVTGSMGSAASAIAVQLNEIMTELYKKISDVQFMIMAIGDFSYDSAPLQVSQFESDIRIAEQLEKVYFEGGGGSNPWESYTAAWYFAAHHTELDAWKRGRKGIIITLGDEILNPYLPRGAVSAVLGDTVQADVDTEELYAQVKEKFDIYHIAIDDVRTSYRRNSKTIISSWGDFLGQNFAVSNCNQLCNAITEIIETSVLGSEKNTTSSSSSDNLISW